MWESKFTLIQNNWYNYVYIYILIFKFLERKTGSEKNGDKYSLNYSALNFFVNAILICCCRYPVLELCYIFKAFNCDFVLHFCDDTTMYFVISISTSRPTFLLPCTRDSVFFFMVYMFLPNIWTSSALTKSWCVPFSSNPSSFSWIYLMAHSKAHLKTNGDKASCFRLFLTENISDRFLPMRTLLYVSFKYILISPIPYAY